MSSYSFLAQLGTCFLNNSHENINNSFSHCKLKEYAIKTHCQIFTKGGNGWDPMLYFDVQKYPQIFQGYW